MKRIVICGRPGISGSPHVLLSKSTPRQLDRSHVGFSQGKGGHGALRFGKLHRGAYKHI